MKIFKTAPTLILLFFSLLSQETKAQHSPKLITKVVGKGQPVVLIPGLTCHGSTWDETIEAMGESYEYHLLTLPGFAGNAPLNSVEKGFFKQTESMVLDYIDKQGLKKPIIIGHSLGGFMALNIAIHKPDLPSKLLIIDALPNMSGIRYPHATAEQIEVIATRLKQSTITEGNQPLEKKTARQKQLLSYMMQSSEKIELTTNWYLNSHVKSIAQALYEMNITDLREDLDKIKVPTLVLGSWLAGKEYGVTRENSLASYSAQYANLKGVKLDMSDKGYHFIMWDDPEFLMNWIKKFL